MCILLRRAVRLSGAWLIQAQWSLRYLTAFTGRWYLYVPPRISQIFCIFAIFELLTAVLLNFQALWDVTFRCWMCTSRRFEISLSPCFHGETVKENLSMDCLTLKMEALAVLIILSPAAITVRFRPKHYAC